MVAAVLLRSRETQVAKVCELGQRLSEHFWFEPKICVPTAKRDCLNIAAVTVAQAPDIGPDAGVVQMLRDDQPIGKPVDFYAPRRGKTDLLRLAEIHLIRGPNHLFFALVGKNEKSTGKGFDLVEVHCQLAENGKGGSSPATPLP